jgi:hypothetical protein
VKEHDWEYLDGRMVTLGGRPYNLWSKSRCKTCGTVRSIAANIATYEPPGESIDIEGYGQVPPPCTEAA